VEGCSFALLGSYAIEFGMGSQENRIAGNEIFDLAAGGVKIGDAAQHDSVAEQSFANGVISNVIHDLGAVHHAAVGIWVGQSSQNIISHNHVHDLFYTAVSVGWTWGYGPNQCRENIIEWNHLHHIGKDLLSDMGAIYTLGVQPGTIIRNNLIHDVSAFTYGGWGIYPDEGSSDMVIENNIVYRTKSASFHQHYGRENIVRNNIFAFGREHQLMRSRAEPHLSFTLEHNIIEWTEGDLLGSVWSDDKYRLDWNVYYHPGTAGEAIRFANWTFEQWKERGQDTHSLIADPLFVDPEHHDFTLKPDSPALKLGFKPFSLSTAGPYGALKGK
jgi:parallel beta helix pectate lyase-like protein